MTGREGVLDLCESLPAAVSSSPFGEDTVVFKVGGKMFTLVDVAGPHGRVTLKADPSEAAALAAEQPGISPGYYMNKRHWITVDLDPDAAVPSQLVRELVEDSYSLVISGLPARLRPVPPNGATG